jgi:hypothetical protein
MTSTKGLLAKANDNKLYWGNTLDLKTDLRDTILEGNDKINFVWYTPHELDHEGLNRAMAWCSDCMKMVAELRKTFAEDEQILNILENWKVNMTIGRGKYAADYKNTAHFEVNVHEKIEFDLQPMIEAAEIARDWAMRRRLIAQIEPLRKERTRINKWISDLDA